MFSTHLDPANKENAFIAKANEETMAVYEDDSILQPVFANPEGYSFMKTASEIIRYNATLEERVERLEATINPISLSIRKRHYMKESSTETESDLFQDIVSSGNENAHGGNVLEDIKLFREMEKDSTTFQDYHQWTGKFRIWYGIPHTMPIHTYTKVIRQALNQKANLHTLRPFSTTQDHTRWTEVIGPFKRLARRLQEKEEGEDFEEYERLAREAIDGYETWKMELKT